MALATCASCGHKVSTTARSCPKCGAPPPKLVYCTRCGTQMLGSATVCPECGTARYDSATAGAVERQADHPSAVNRPSAALPQAARAREIADVTEPDWRCPKCSGENVQKLSVIYSEGTTSSRQGAVGLGLGESEVVGAVLGGGMSSTTLATTVAPPTAPKGPSAVTDMRLAAGCATLLIFLLCGLLFLLFLASPPVEHLSVADEAGGAILCAMIPLIFWWRLSSGARSLKQKQDAEYRVKRVAYNEALALHNEAMGKWQRSYFCHRCGNVFEL
jgi:hypothetical protein